MMLLMTGGCREMKIFSPFPLCSIPRRQAIKMKDNERSEQQRENRGQMMGLSEKTQQALSCLK